MQSFIRNIVVAFALLLVSVAVSAQECPEGGDTLRGGVPDTLRRTYRHTDAVKLLTIQGDTLAARDIWREIVSEDEEYAPAHYYLSMIGSCNDAERLDHARRAFVADSSNKWYVQHYATALLENNDYIGALPVYRRLLKLDQRDVRVYYALAYLYDINEMPYSAIAVLDSLDIRLGRDLTTSEFKQHLLVETKQYDRAVTNGVAVVEEFPYSIKARIHLAFAYELAGRDTMSMRTLEDALLVDSTNVDVLDVLVGYNLRKGNYERVFDYELQLMNSDEISAKDKVDRLWDYTYDTNLYAKYYFRIGTLVQALALKHPDNRDVIDLYASHLIRGGESERTMALDYLRSHLSDATSIAEDYIYVMQLEAFMNREDLIFEDLKTAMELYPANLSILSYAGFICGEYGNYRGAINIFKQCLNIVQDDNDRSIFWGYIGDVYHEQGNDNKAFKSYDKALRYNADNVLVLNNYAYFLSLKDKNLEMALAMSSRAVALESDNSSYLDTHAWVLHRLGRNDEAKGIMRQALSLSSQRDINLLMHFGDILWALGEKFLAETYWEKAVDNGFDSEEMERHKAEIMKQ